MPYRTTTAALSVSLAASLAASLLALLLPTPAATAQERITLEVIGAVRMARLDPVRGVSPATRPTQATPARDPAAERAAKAR